MNGLQNAIMLLGSGRRNMKQIQAVAKNPAKMKKLIKELQARDIGVGINPDNIAKWIELILKFLPIVLEILKNL